MGDIDNSKVQFTGQPIEIKTKGWPVRKVLVFKENGDAVYNVGFITEQDKVTVFAGLELRGDGELQSSELDPGTYTVILIGDPDNGIL